MSETVTFGGARPQRDFPKKKLAVLQAAAAAFVENGVAQTSLDDIAERLKVTKPAVYYYVKSKDQIVAECIALARADDEANIARISDLQVDGLEKVRLAMLYYGTAIQEGFGRFLATVDLHALSETSMAEHRRSQRFLFESCRRLLLEGVEDGSVRPCDPTTVTFAMVGALNSTTRWFDPKGPRSVDSVIDEIWSLLRGGIAAAGR